MYKDLLPLGSVVLLKGGSKRLMIIGRIQSRAGSNEIYDYSGCFFPEGLTDPHSLYFFNRDAIEKTFFLGCQDEEELLFHQQVLDQLGELEIRDGQIVPTESK